MANAVIWARFITRAEVTLTDNTTQVFEWAEGRNGNCPVCNGGALSVETWETGGNFLTSIVFAPGVWHHVKIDSELRKVEVPDPNQKPAAAN